MRKIPFLFGATIELGLPVWCRHEMPPPYTNEYIDRNFGEDRRPFIAKGIGFTVHFQFSIRLNRGITVAGPFARQAGGRGCKVHVQSKQ